ncbi:MAG TPA: hypothetical protein VGQ57_03785, partial [Polyangiaceae bacterium]|nr:hypothetical protein [Polyangiaceae bacterium]
MAATEAAGSTGSGNGTTAGGAAATSCVTAASGPRVVLAVDTEGAPLLAGCDGLSATTAPITPAATAITT